MLADLNERLETVVDQKRQKAKWTAMYRELEAQLKEEEQKEKRLGHLLEKEEEDVKKLEGLSVSNFLYTVIGKKLERLEKERQEAVAAKLKYDEAVHTVEDMKSEMIELSSLLAPLHHVDQTYETLLQEKEALIKDTATVWSEELFALSEKKAELSSELKEYDEAIQAGQSALSKLSHVIESLDKAKGWSTFDLFGGGLISTAIKHDHLDTAKGEIHSAQNALRKFESELKDIQRQFGHVHIDIGEFLSFADYFFDGFIVDWTVHGKINDSLEQAEQVYHQVDDVVREINKEREKIHREREQTEHRRIDTIKKAQ
ncbi:hypothetical protein [Caldalkalibacillus salinus]|uniref:hypothetical protein n=1 Tax=Caldalkalibacillus salinus TaxID=2803787 RepID=UPI001922F1EB|nr:hypothetical protein [Caldalkalibacillus salinus]